MNKTIYFLFSILPVILVAEDAHIHSEKCAHAASPQVQEAHADQEGHDHAAHKNEHEHEKTDTRHAHDNEVESDKHDEHDHDEHVHDKEVESDKHEGHDHDEHGHEEGECPASTSAPPSFQIPMTSARLLGLSFAKAQLRSITDTHTFPGRLEIPPEANRQISSLLPGRIHLLVSEGEIVHKGEPLFTLESPEWLQRQADLEQTRAEMQTREKETALLSERIQRLQQANVRNAELEAELAVKPLQIKALQRKIKDMMTLQEFFSARMTGGSNGVFTVSAPADGWVSSLQKQTGEWVQSGEAPVSFVVGNALRLRAEAQAQETAAIDLSMQAILEPPQGMTDAESVSDGIFRFGKVNPESGVRSLLFTPKTIHPWMKAGMPARLSLVRTKKAKREIAVPSSAIVSEGAQFFVFAKKAKSTDQYVKFRVTPGDTANGWTAVAGIPAGTEVVVDGAYEVKLIAPSEEGQKKKTAGHFHADGKFHEGAH